ncbi:MAG: DUF1549 domain-containing protein [Verrucomicrobia bacterium]|nr:DUF1549 domain-containing protein [Verrucomicrobiota bacterium]
MTIRSSAAHWFARAARLFAVVALASGVRAEEASFRNDVMAVLSKTGCNLGTCHGNASGKASFKLSLRGQDPDLDWLALTRDQFARRVNPLEPDASLLLLKATAALAHEGGQRFKKDSDEYRILQSWIAAGAGNDTSTARKLARLEVSPREQILVEPVKEVRIQAKAIFSDGSQRDVGALAVYEPANLLVKVTREGLVQREKTGETTVLVRYLDQQAPVRLAFVPARPDFKWAAPLVNNYVDEQVFTKLRSLRTNPSELCADEVFLRRAFLDLLGMLPSVEEAKKFVAEKSANKRAQLVDKLLARPEFADFWALKWSDLLKNEERQLDETGVKTFHAWIRQSFADNKPLDLFVRELLTARGSTYSNAPANFFRANRDPVTRAETVAQVFLGTRLNCAQCHNHPFDRWTQDDYYNWAGVFARVDYKIIENRRRDKSDKHEFIGEQLVQIKSSGSVTNTRTGKPASPKFLGGAMVTATEERDELQALAEWLTGPENKQFARTQANRVWFHLMGRGLVDPLDDMRSTNPATHPALLDALAKDFVGHKFDVRHLIRVVMASRTYQLASEPNATNADDEVNYSHNVVRRLTAEQLLDAAAEVTQTKLELKGVPDGGRAAQMPFPKDDKRVGKNAEERFLAVFGKPPRLLPSECERNNETAMRQAFQLISGETINDMVSAKDNRLGKLLNAGQGSREIVEELYWASLNRAPAKAELEKSVAYAETAKDKRKALEDVLWALLNAKDFLLRK